MYVCTYQQIQDMLSLQSDCIVVTHQEEFYCPILYYKENNNDVCTDGFYIHVQLCNIKCTCILNILLVLPFYYMCFTLDLRRNSGITMPTHVP